MEASQKELMKEQQLITECCMCAYVCVCVCVCVYVCVCVCTGCMCSYLSNVTVYRDEERGMASH